MVFHFRCSCNKQSTWAWERNWKRAEWQSSNTTNEQATRAAMIRRPSLRQVKGKVWSWKWWTTWERSRETNWAKSSLYRDNRLVRNKVGRNKRQKLDSVVAAKMYLSIHLVGRSYIIQVYYDKKYLHWRYTACIVNRWSKLMGLSFALMQR